MHTALAGGAIACASPSPIVSQPTKATGSGSMTSDQNSPVIEHSAQGAPPPSSQQESLFGGSSNGTHGMGQSKSSRRRRRKRKSKADGDTGDQRGRLLRARNAKSECRLHPGFRPPRREYLPPAEPLSPAAPSTRTIRAAHQPVASAGKRSSATASAPGGFRE